MDTIHFIGHSSLLITLDGMNFFVDPNFSGRILGIVKRIGYPAAIDVNHLPETSALLVTHGAHDHLDIHTYKYFKQDLPVIAPRGLKAFIGRYVHHPVTELSPWSETSFGSVKITAAPARHGGFHIPGTRHIPPVGYLLQGSSHTVYVSSDTAYGSHFSEIARSSSMDVACLPIGHYSPRWLMGARHMNPREALAAFRDTNARVMIPIGWGSFPISTEELSQPIKILREAARGTPLNESVRPLVPGESLSLSALNRSQTPALAYLHATS